MSIWKYSGALFDHLTNIRWLIADRYESNATIRDARLISRRDALSWAIIRAPTSARGRARSALLEALQEDGTLSCRALALRCKSSEPTVRRRLRRLRQRDVFRIAAVVDPFKQELSVVAIINMKVDQRGDAGGQVGAVGDAGASIRRRDGGRLRHGRRGVVPLGGRDAVSSAARYSRRFPAFSASSRSRSTKWLPTPTTGESGVKRSRTRGPAPVRYRSGGHWCERESDGDLASAGGVTTMSCPSGPLRAQHPFSRERSRASTSASRSAATRPPRSTPGWTRTPCWCSAASVLTRRAADRVQPQLPESWRATRPPRT